MHCDNDIYEGFEISGAPQHVISNGKIMIRYGQWNNIKRKGKFLKRKRLLTW
jgi:dihydroorotase-like cyclic amidohydrolase